MLNVSEDTSRAEASAEASAKTPWNAANARLSETVDNLYRLMDHLEKRLALVMNADDVDEIPWHSPDDRGSPAVTILHHHANRIFDVNERLSAILDRLDI